ncbi:sensor histidine kinase [Paenibacillus sp. GCM10023252]|uniref:sensor histidine kinase n=1 Tax=Paenibacillus sp. GCM10023252 TaxID=3252649 RepID=UPI00361EED49
MQLPFLPQGKTRSLRQRLVAALIVSVLIPLALLGVTSYSSIYSLLNNRVEKGIQSNLEVERISLENTLNNLDFASKQLAYGTTGIKIQNYLKASASEKVGLLRSVNETLESVLYTNVVIGTMFYYVPETKEYLFDYYNVNNEKDPADFPLLNRKKNVEYFAFHPSMNLVEPRPVLSILRKVDGMISDNDFYVYLETSSLATRNIFREEQYGFPVSHVLTDADNQVVYSEKPELIPVGSKLQPGEDYGGHVSYAQESSKGWRLIAFIAREDIQRDINKWLLRFLIISAITIMTSLVLAWIIWRTISRPLSRFKEEIRWISMNRLEKEVVPMGILEFDDVLKRFAAMKVQIGELLAEVEEKENRKRRLEVEKLMNQINPHFLHNTLNTIQWIAMMNGQKEIVTLVKVFTRVLHYNLGKEGGIVRLADEVQALRDYIQLQQIRYNYTFRVDIDVEEEAGSFSIPRFSLQPLVENALYHAFKDEGGIITVTAEMDTQQHLVLTVTDNGQGMTEDKVNALLSDNSGPAKGFGIGLNYVNNLVQLHFGPPYRLDVKSKLGEGTTMTIRIPAIVKENAND